MKRLLAFLLLSFLTVLPVYAQRTSVEENARQSQKAQKRQMKAMKKASKKQQKAMHKSAKAQQKALRKTHQQAATR